MYNIYKYYIKCKGKLAPLGDGYFEKELDFMIKGEKPLISRTKDEIKKLDDKRKKILKNNIKSGNWIYKEYKEDDGLFVYILIALKDEAWRIPEFINTKYIKDIKKRSKRVGELLGYSKDDIDLFLNLLDIYDILEFDFSFHKKLIDNYINNNIKFNKEKFKKYYINLVLKKLPLLKENKIYIQYPLNYIINNIINIIKNNYKNNKYNKNMIYREIKNKINKKELYNKLELRAYRKTFNEVNK